MEVAPQHSTTFPVPATNWLELVNCGGQLTVYNNCRQMGFAWNSLEH